MEINKEEMLDLLSKSKSMREVIISLGLSPNGSGGYRYVKDKIIKLGLEIPKYHYYGDPTLKQKYSDEDVFCKNSTFPRQKIKNRIIKNNLLKYECSVCKNDGNWNGFKLSLHLDHVNGVNNDNRICNLRFLCPNCHSQTDTYGGKSNKKEKIKKDRPRKVIRPDKEIILKDVEELGYSATGRKYGVSDNAIRKWLK
jgi:Zn finger protein HypA/HybF involved in hydrogenase expression